MREKKTKGMALTETRRHGKTVSATLKPGREYEATGTGTGGLVRVWLQDVQSGEIVSKVAEQPLVHTPDRGPEYIPIVVPVR